MKKFTETLIAIKSAAAFIFAGQIMVFAVIGRLVGDTDSMPFSHIWQALAISLVTALLQYVFFDDRVIQKMRYSLRIVLFSVPLLAILSALALIGKWFPVDKAGAWLLFAGIFLGALAVTTAVFEIYYRITGRKYTDRLQSFRANREE